MIELPKRECVKKWSHFNIKIPYTKWINIIKMRRPHNRIVFFIETPYAWKDSLYIEKKNTIQWRHNGHDSVSNHQRHDCLSNRLFRRRSKKTSKLRVTGLMRGIHRVPVNSPHKWPITRKIFPFDDVIMMYCVCQSYPVDGGSSVFTLEAINTGVTEMWPQWTSLPSMCGTRLVKLQGE